MQDRIPTYPGLVELTDPETGASKLYYMAMADNPTVAGTPLNKNTLLKDSTAALFGLTSAAVPDDVLVAISNKMARVESGSYTGNGTYGSDHKNSITFSFIPKIVLITRANTGSGYPMLTPYMWGEDFFWTGNFSSHQNATVTINDNTMYWYTGGNSSYQLNQNGNVYNFVAIG